MLVVAQPRESDWRFGRRVSKKRWSGCQPKPVANCRADKGRVHVATFPVRFRPRLAREKVITLRPSDRGHIPVPLRRLVGPLCAILWAENVAAADCINIGPRSRVLHPRSLI